MMERYELGMKNIGEVRRGLVETPTVVGPSDNVSTLVAKINEDLRTRHVYVVNDGGDLIGTVRIASIMKYLFPYISPLTAGVSLTPDTIRNFSATKVSDLMIEDPLFVRDDTTLEDCAKIMLDEGVSELPVVDKGMKLVGQINVFEMIQAYETAGNGSQNR